MNRKIGFTANGYTENKDITIAYTERQVYNAPRKSVVQVYFAARNMTLAYYNDKFDLACGDFVYVDGKLEGVQGRIVGVNYNFKIKASDYQRVIALVDTNVNGKLSMAGSHFVTFDCETLPKEKILTWFKAPPKEEDEIISGSDDKGFMLEDFDGFNISPIVAERGSRYYKENKVRYINLDGDKGFAIIEGNEAYEVDFEYQNGEIRNITCSCFCNRSCKHEFAAMLQLKETLELIEKNYSEEYESTGYFAAISKGTLFEFAIDNKQKGSFVL